MTASALKPSYFNSKIHAGSSNGAARFKSGIGWNGSIGILYTECRKNATPRQLLRKLKLLAVFLVNCCFEFQSLSIFSLGLQPIREQQSYTWNRLRSDFLSTALALDGDSTKFPF